MMKGTPIMSTLLNALKVTVAVVDTLLNPLTPPEPPKRRSNNVMQPPADLAELGRGLGCDAALAAEACAAFIAWSVRLAMMETTDENTFASDTAAEAKTREAMARLAERLGHTILDQQHRSVG